MPRSDGGMSFIRAPPIVSSPAVMSSRPAIIPQQRRLAATRRADEYHELAVADRQVDIAQHRDVAKGLCDVAQLDLSHALVSSLSLLAVAPEPAKSRTSHAANKPVLACLLFLL